MLYRWWINKKKTFLVYHHPTDSGGNFFFIFFWLITDQLIHHRDAEKKTGFFLSNFTFLNGKEWKNIHVNKRKKKFFFVCLIFLQLKFQSFLPVFISVSFFSTHPPPTTRKDILMDIWTFFSDGQSFSFQCMLAFDDRFQIIENFVIDFLFMEYQLFWIRFFFDSITIWIEMEWLNECIFFCYKFFFTL